jgi:hypothetical protein
MEIFFGVSDNSVVVVVDHDAYYMESNRYMAIDELRSITIDKWDDEVWGIAQHPSRDPTEEGVTTVQPPPKTVFYFGKSDHWVAEKTKEDIIRMRGSSFQNTTATATSTTDGDGDDKTAASGKRRPKMVVCEEGLPHAFCLSKFFSSFRLSSLDLVSFLFPC